MTAQLTFLRDLALAPTPAMVKGESVVASCSWCGTTVAVPGYGVTGVDQEGLATRPRDLGPCPCCGRRSWRRHEVTHGHINGPFHSVRQIYCTQCGCMHEES